jgi:hypothetical protein
MMGLTSCAAETRGGARCSRDGLGPFHIHGEGIVLWLCRQHSLALHRVGLWTTLAGNMRWLHKQTRWCANCHPDNNAALVGRKE